jgi:hypothetical protein
MAFNIEVNKGWFVVANSSSGENWIRNTREDTMFTVEVSTDTYRFFRNDSQLSPLGDNNHDLLYTDLNEITEDGVSISFSTVADVTEYLEKKVGFFFNPDPLNSSELITANTINNDRVINHHLKTLITEQKLTNQLLKKIYNPI